jgi:hypothetical protein
MLNTADETGSFKQSDFDTLEQDDTFMAWMEENNMKMIDLTTASYTEQYNIIARFYSDLGAM